MHIGINSPGPDGYRGSTRGEKGDKRFQSTVESPQKAEPTFDWNERNTKKVVS
jgi:hypothetical protein